MIFCQLLGNIVNVAISALLIHLVSETSSSLTLFLLTNQLQAAQKLNSETINYALFAIILTAAMFPYCYFGTRLIHKFSLISNHVFHSSWYKLPIGHQKALKFLLQYSQTDRSIKAYSLVECTLSTFLRVRKTLSLKNKFLFNILFHS